MILGLLSIVKKCPHFLAEELGPRQLPPVYLLTFVLRHFLLTVSAWSGLASTLGIKQKSVLSQVTSEDGSTCFAFKYACCSQFTNILTSSKIDIFPKSKEFVISVILRRWLMVVFISCILVSGGYSMCVCELEIRLLFMKTQECVKSRSIDGQMCSRC